MEKSINYVLNLCQTLHGQGKTPTVALVKAHAQKPLGLKDVLEGIKRWKADPEQTIAAELEQEPLAVESENLKTKVQHLEQRLAKMEVQLEQLLKRINHGD